MDEWERLERRWKITVYIVGMSVGAIVLFLLLMFVARHSGGKAQDQFSLICVSIICERMMHEGGRGGER